MADTRNVALAQKKYEFDCKISFNGKKEKELRRRMDFGSMPGMGFDGKGVGLEAFGAILLCALAL